MTVVLTDVLAFGAAACGLIAAMLIAGEQGTIDFTRDPVTKAKAIEKKRHLARISLLAFTVAGIVVALTRLSGLDIEFTLTP